MFRRLLARLIVVSFGTVCFGSELYADNGQATPDFVKDIQPLFRKNCYSCHGPEEQEGGLRLDVKRLAMEGGDGGTVIVPNNSAQSRLIKLIAGLDDEVGIMPPDGEGTPLTKENVGLIRAWIDNGAPWPASADAELANSSHWAFHPVTRPKAPQVKQQNWIRNEVDRYILRRLEKDGIQPSPEADRAMLIRRLYLDLLGLPPTPEEAAAFINDAADGAYERLVDRVLESEHYGERWGRHWLDLARYADSDGYEKDRARPHAWRYRDWVIQALNQDMPFDRFSQAQIAGDMLPDAQLAHKIAVGFHRNTLHNTEGGTDPEEDRVKKTVDRTNTVGAIWLGLTVGCAQCHSHKYDPISHREYYALYGFFNNIDETDISAPSTADLAAFETAQANHTVELATGKSALEEYVNNEFPIALQRWEDSLGENPASWTLLRGEKVVSKAGAKFTLTNDGALLAEGANTKSDAYTFETVSPLPAITALRLEVLPSDKLPHKGPGRADNGNFVLATFSATAAPLDGGAPTQLKFDTARADFSQTEWDVAKAINDNPDDGWAVSPQIGKRHVAVFRLAKPLATTGGAKLVVTLDQNYNGANPHNIGQFRLSATDASNDVPLDGIPSNVELALQTPRDNRSVEQKKTIFDYYQTIDGEYLKRKAIVDAIAKKPPVLPADKKAQSVMERSAPRPLNVHLRGNFLDPGQAVSLNTPTVLPPVTARDEKLDRLDFANWLFEPKHPLTARVTVNRIWQRYFGRGIVPTVDDFGKQGDPPSHPDLLDFLATELRQNDWRLKHIHKLIVTSATYRQTSAARPDLQEIDPLNVLLARQNRRRVEAEIVRDAALAASGLLNRKLGGPSVRPPQPSEYSSLTYANSAKWAVSKNGDEHRRGMYTFFQRTSPYPMLMTFDSPDSTVCIAERVASNTPLQALTIWNDPVFVECAQALGGRAASQESGDSSDSVNQRLIYAFQLCLTRSPTPDEVDILREVYDSQLTLAEHDEVAAKQLIGDRPTPNGLSATQLSAFVAVARVLLNLDEFITKE